VLRLCKIAAVFGFAVLLPVVASAQAAISGVVRDTSGAVLPGVTVEASSPALIEKVRVTVTDGAGLYAIENLRPGTYTVRFTLPGFSVVQRDGIQLQGTFNARINADLQVGGLEETIMVTGEAPIIDVASTEQQRVMDRALLDALPTAGRRTALSVLIPAVDFRSQDVGGAGTTALTGNPTAHGARSEDAGTTLDGISIASFGTSASTATIFLNPMAIEEVNISTGSNNAELHAGGVRTNYIPKSGGNNFSGVVFGAYAPGELQSNNLDDDLIARGLQTPNEIKQLWDINPAVGGPIMRDKVWFYVAARYNVASDYVAGMYANKNVNDPTSWQYDPDTSRPVFNEAKNPDTQSRVTWQATDRMRFGFLHYDTSQCFCPGGVSISDTEEATVYDEYPLQRLFGGDWQMPVNNNLLFELKGQVYISHSDDAQSDLLTREQFVWGPNGETGTLVPAQDRSTRLNYRAANSYRWLTQQVNSLAGSMSYITGSHALKVGFGDKWGGQHFLNWDSVPVSYRIRNGIAGDGTPRPDRISLSAYADPGPDGRDSTYAGWRADAVADLGVYVQDRWTMDRLTLNLGLRYDYFKNNYPEQRFGPAALAPDRDITFPAQDGWPLHDLSPRLSAVYDVTGQGTTAVKASLNRYVLAMGPDAGYARLGNPGRNLVMSATRTWNDANGDFIPDCDLTAATPGRNGECGPLSNAAFGTGIATLNVDEDAVTGWGKRRFNWETSVGVQHELMPNVSLDVTYFRRWYGNFDTTVDLATTPADFDRYSVTAPMHPDLPGGGGYVLDGLYDIKPEVFGRPIEPLVTLSREYGKERDYWDGADFVLNARPGAGTFFQGGVSTGRRVEDNCDIVSKASLVAVSARGALTTSRATPSTLFCRREEPLATRFKGYGAFTIPVVDVQLAATYQNKQGGEVLAEYTFTNADIMPSLGRPLSGGESSVDVGLVSPGQYGRWQNQTQGEVTGERLQQVDFRISKLMNFGGARARLNLDIYNAFNANSILVYQETFDQFLDPAEILVARFFKFSAQFDFY
jgi:hypothetical protein